MIHRTLSFLSLNSKYKIKMCQYINQMIWNIYKSFLMSGLAGQLNILPNPTGMKKKPHALLLFHQLVFKSMQS